MKETKSSFRVGQIPLSDGKVVHVHPIRFGYPDGITYDILVPHPILVRLFGDHYEVPELILLRKVYDKHDRVLEIGSGIGYVTCVIAGVAEYVIGIEPLIDLVKVSLMNLEGNKLSNAAILHGFGATADGVTLYNRRHSVCSSSIFPDSDDEVGKTEETIEVPTWDVNKIINEHSINIVHLDVEGYEKELIPYILSSPDTIASIDKLTWEVHTAVLGMEGNLSLFRQVRDAGFEIVAVSGLYYFPRRTYTVCFARKHLVQELCGRIYTGDCGSVEPESFWRLAESTE